MNNNLDKITNKHNDQIIKCCNKKKNNSKHYDTTKHI